MSGHRGMHRFQEQIKAECRKSLSRLHIDSNVFYNENEEEPDSVRSSSKGVVNKIRETDIERGEILGTGGFSNIRSIVITRRSSLFTSAGLSNGNEIGSSQTHECTNSTSSTIGGFSSCGGKNFVDDDCTIDGEEVHNVSADINIQHSHEKYAVKSIRQSIDNSKLYAGALDLAKEAKFLSALSHDHIIGIHSEGENVGTLDYFIIIERIQICLSKQIKFWKTKKTLHTYEQLGVRNQAAKYQKQQLDKRLLSMYQVSSGLAYMHQKNILFRDLKPDNIGISFTGQAKIFDFGLATELKLQDKVAEDQYHATQMCGTRRYMAQEVFYGKPYGLPADVYSFSHVLWETATLEIPYKGRLPRAHIRYTYKLKQRPRVRMKWPKDLKRWIKRGWCHKPESRMKMESICSEMRQYLNKV